MMKNQAQIESLSNPLLTRVHVSAIKTVLATIQKELIIARRYLPNFLGTFMQIALRVGFFLFLSGIITFGGNYNLSGKEIFIFISCSFLLFVFFSTALWVPLNTVTTDLYNGTLEYLYTLPSSRYAYFAGTVLASSLINMVFFIPLFIFLALYSGAQILHLLLVLLVCAMGIIVTIALGILISLLGLVWKQINALLGFLAMMFEFLAGAYVPINEYPLVVKCVAYLLPFTWGYDLIRYYMFDGKWATICPLWIEWAVFLAMAFLYLLVSRYLLKEVGRRVKSKGLHVI
jgi:ABC-2 type transport system permease protein